MRDFILRCGVFAFLLLVAEGCSWATDSPIIEVLLWMILAGQVIQFFNRPTIQFHQGEDSSPLRIVQGETVITVMPPIVGKETE